MNFYVLKFDIDTHTINCYCVASNSSSAEQLSRESIGNEPTLVGMQLMVRDVFIEQSQAEKEYIALQEAGVDNWIGFLGALDTINEKEK